jgi:GTPase
MSRAVVAIVGAPNVGKSTLFNRLVGRRQAIVGDAPGVTRDRLYAEVLDVPTPFRLVDTGGLMPDGEGAYAAEIERQVRIAIAEAACLVFVVDAVAGPTAVDRDVATILRKSGRSVVLAANKIDTPKAEPLIHALHELGLGDPVGVSAEHGRGIDDLLDRVEAELGSASPPDPRGEAGPEEIRLALVGRPNVGKSSILNRLAGEERAVVSEVPGTTRDAIDTVLTRGERTFVLVDTAGLRRKRRQRQGIEYYSELRALAAAERADVALVLVDASEGLVEQDLAVADVARKAWNSTLVVLAKWDATTMRIEEVTPQLRRRLRQRPPVIAVSAHTGRGIARLLDRTAELFDKHTARIPTPELNRFLRELREKRQPPSRGGKRLNLLYGAQVRTRPPRFRFSVNDPSLITRDYGYWVENQLRERFSLDGVPFAIDFVRRS